MCQWIRACRTMAKLAYATGFLTFKDVHRLTFFVLSFLFPSVGFELGLCREAFSFEAGHHRRVIVNAG